MGFFKKRTRDKEQKNRQNIDVTEVSAVPKKETGKTVRLNTQKEQLGYIKDSCELILDSTRQIEEAKAEYSAVTSYLTDIQRIDLIPLEQRGNMEDAARNIFNLTKERNKLQNRSSILSDQQYRLFELYEIQIPKELSLVKDGENYQEKIQQDMENLEKERESLDDQQEEIINKQAFLKGIAITTSVIVIILFVVFLMISYYSKTSFKVPFLLTVLMGMVSAFYIFMESRKNLSEVGLVQLKQNRQIMLMNKVKIKSVNNRNFLDYTYNKYTVENYEQLKTYWEEYVRLKDENKRYQSNTQLLDFYNNELIHELKKFKIADAEIWIFQPSAILDGKEMVEVRHRLNIRRQKLRERIDLNLRQKEDSLASIKSTIRSYRDCEEEAKSMLRRYRIEIEE